MDRQIPGKQTALQLTGPDQLAVNNNKEVFQPGPYQILGKVEVVGLCFSDLKLLKQFDTHVRKSDVVSGIDLNILSEIPSYVPNEKPTVPGHEAVIRVCAIGDKVKNITVGNRYLVQADYRWIRTANSNGAFGYNFEGGLQEYVLLDQRIITSPDGESMLLPASEDFSASAIALAEPWACVEEAYAYKERTTLRKDGKMLVVADTEIQQDKFNQLLSKYGKPAKITVIGKKSQLDSPGIEIETADGIDAVAQRVFDDVLYFGSDTKTAEALFPRVAQNGLINFVLCGGKFDSEVSAPVGWVHYGNMRIIGTTGSDPNESMKYIPSSAEIRKGDKINIVGAGGPMGVMHVVRNICQGVKDVTVYAGDLDDNRLDIVRSIAEPLADKNKVGFESYNPIKKPIDIEFDYTSIMAPVPKLVANAIKTSADKAIINIFAGIPASINGPLDLNLYISKKMYLIGTSGSTIEDMKILLDKVQTNRLDTNISVAAVCGLNHAADGIRAVENHKIPGKIIIYPVCKDLPLTPLTEIHKQLPDVAEKLVNGLWNAKAEKAFIKHFS